MPLYNPSTGGTAANKNVQTVTSAYTVLTTDGTILCDATTAGFTVTLPTATGNAGLEITLKKTDSTFNIVTLSGTGLTTTYLHTVGEAVRLVSNGTSWSQTWRKTDTPWTVYSPTLSNFGTVTSPQIYWRRTGDSIQIKGRGVFGTTVAATASISLPTGTITGGADYVFSGNFFNGSAVTNYSILARSGDTAVVLGNISGGNGFTVQQANNIGSSGQVFSFVSAPIPILNFAS